MKRLREFRLNSQEIACERRGDDDAPILKGYGSIFEKWSKGLPWKEKVQRGAFAKTVGENDIRALWNHNTDLPLGRTKAGTLRLEEDKKGLRVEIDPPETSAGRDAVESIGRGDVTGMSIGFEVVQDDWNDKMNERVIKEVKLFEVSPVTFPAFPQTSIKVRSIVPDFEPDFDLEHLTALMYRRSRGEQVTAADEEFLNAAIQTLRDFIAPGDDAPADPEPSDDGHSQGNSEPTKSHSMTLHRMRIVKLKT